MVLWFTLTLLMLTYRFVDENDASMVIFCLVFNDAGLHAVDVNVHVNVLDPALVVSFILFVCACVC